MTSNIQNSPQQSANAEAFPEVYLCFLVSALAKKNAEAIALFGILKTYFSKNKKKYFFV